MLTGWGGSQAILNRVQVRGARLDAGLVGPRLHNLLRYAELRPAGLPASAILCINTLHDPLPGLLRLERSGETLPVAWDKALSNRLDQLVQQAARPLDAPASGAEAVLFTSPAELLACLAMDWASGQLRTRWWWQSLLGKLTASDIRVIELWQETPEYVPAALQMLAAREELDGFIRRWEPAPARLLLKRLIDRFGLAGLKLLLTAANPGHKPPAILALNSSEVTAPAPPVSPASQFPTSGPTTDNSAPPYASPPWQNLVLEGNRPGLSLAQVCLVGVGLMLYRAPEKLRAPVFARSLAAWLDFEVKRTSSETAPAVKSSLPPDFPRRVTPSLVDARPDLTQGQMASDFSAQTRPHLTFEALNPAVETPGLSSKLLPLTIKFDVAIPLGNGARIDETPKVSGPQIEFSGPLKTTFVSEYAGVFYLVNLGLFLDLYGDFTQPTRPGLPLPIWDFLALLGEGLAGKKLRRDVIWTALAELAGRPAQEKPGQFFEPVANWRMPPGWLKPFPEKDYTWEVRAGRVRVRHPANFPLVDIALDPARPVEAQLELELRNYPVGRLKRWSPPGSPKPPAPSGEVERWLGWLLPYVKARLGRAFGLTPGRAGRLLCRQNGQVRLDESNLEVHISLEQHLLAIRLAGLDRDPGWVPAAGRYVSFIFN